MFDDQVQTVVPQGANLAQPAAHAPSAESPNIPAPPPGDPPAEPTPGRFAIPREVTPAPPRKTRTEMLAELIPPKPPTRSRAQIIAEMFPDRVTAEPPRMTREEVLALRFPDRVRPSEPASPPIDPAALIAIRTGARQSGFNPNAAVEYMDPSPNTQRENLGNVTVDGTDVGAQIITNNYGRAVAVQVQTPVAQQENVGEVRIRVDGVFGAYGTGVQAEFEPSPRLLDSARDKTVSAIGTVGKWMGINK